MTAPPAAIVQRADDQPLRRDPMTELAVLDRLGTPRAALTGFFLEYKFGIEEVSTKLRILQEAFLALHEYKPSRCGTTSPHPKPTATAACTCWSPRRCSDPRRRCMCPWRSNSGPWR
jgi:hypothetical protein